MTQFELVVWGIVTTLLQIAGYVVAAVILMSVAKDLFFS